MRPLAVLLGLAAIGLGVFFETMPETRGGNWFIITCGVVALLLGIGMLREETLRRVVPPSPTPPPAPPHKETPAELAERAERYWRTGQDPKSHIHCAAQFRAYVERGEPRKAEEFLAAMSPEFYRAVKSGAKIIREYEERN